MGAASRNRADLYAVVDENMPLLHGKIANYENKMQVQRVTRQLRC